MFERILRFFKTTPCSEISKFCSESFHRLTDRRVVCKFRVIWPTRNPWNHALLAWQKDIISSGSRAVATARIAPKICQSQPLRKYSECSRFHPNRFTFGGVIAERVNTAKTRRQVNPIFDRGRTSSRITSYGRWQYSRGWSVVRYQST